MMHSPLNVKLAANGFLDLNAHMRHSIHSLRISAVKIMCIGVTKIPMQLMKYLLHDLKVKTLVTEEKISSYNSTEFIRTSILRQLTDERIMPNNAVAHKENCSI